MNLKSWLSLQQEVEEVRKTMQVTAITCWNLPSYSNGYYQLPSTPCFEFSTDWIELQPSPEGSH